MLARVTAPPPNTSTRRLGRDALIYALAFVLQRAASFVMLPVYTRYFSTEDYGVLQLLQTSLDVASILFSAGITAGLHRFYFRSEDREHRNAVVAGSFRLLLGMNMAGAVALYVASPLIASGLLGGRPNWPLVCIAGTSFMLDALLTVPLLYLQAEQRSFHYALGSLARLIVQLTLNIVFVVGFDTGVVGILWSTLITHLTLGVGLAVWMLRRTGWAAPKALRRELFRFGLPYRVTAAGAFVLTYGDRFFLEDAHGLGEVGVYSLAYQFGFLLMSLGPGPFHLAWDPQRFQLAQRPLEEREPLYQSGFFFFSVLVLTLAVGIALFVRPLLTVMSAPEFHRAADLVPFVMAAFVCQSFGEVMDFGIQVSGKTIWTSVATWVAVVVTLIAYALLVPPYAGLGAALATFAGFSVRWILYRRFAQRLFPIDYKVSRAFGLIVLAAAVVGSAFWVRPQGFFPEVAVATAGSLVFIGLTFALVMRRDERRVLLAYVSNRLKRKS